MWGWEEEERDKEWEGEKRERAGGGGRISGRGVLVPSDFYMILEDTFMIMGGDSIQY